jgi:butyryl-CoA dehydrogenase
MPHILNRADLDFLLFDVLRVEELTHRTAFAGQERGEYGQLLDLAERLAEERFQPHAARLDADEPRIEGGRVVMHRDVQVALDAYHAAGFHLMGLPQAEGGMGLPETVTQAVRAWFSAANIGTAAYPFLSAAAMNLLLAHGTPWQRDTFLRPMVEGRWFGTMCLSEPEVGSSLGDIRTRAEPMADGRFRVSGAKMWISGGDHELSENIVHLVLARLPDAPPGTRGLSLLIVPKMLPDGRRNDVELQGLNHKMGCRAATNCALAFGPRGGAEGWLVGAPHQGLALMFRMMNEARIGVGLGASALAVSGYLHARAWAMDRRQGRPIDAKDAATPMIPIIGHPDVRRMLLQAKCYAEGGLALCLAAARLVDEMRTGPDPLTARRLLDILTPVVKSWPAEFGLRANDLAIQVLGGAGYTCDHPVERLWRDNRLNAIHEGTKGIQALDLLGRKVVQEDGACLRLLMEEIAATVHLATGTALGDHAAVLAAAAARTQAVTEAIWAGARPGAMARPLANATLYLDMLGHVVVGWIWLRVALAADRLIEGAEGERRAFLRGKRHACDWFYRYELPATGLWADILMEPERSFFEMAAEEF